MKTKNNKHTPGPWKVKRNNMTLEIDFDCEQNNPDILNKNAALIAAAPEMFSILQDCLNELDKYKNYFPKNAKIDHLMDIIGLTINKARGE